MTITVHKPGVHEETEDTPVKPFKAPKLKYNGDTTATALYASEKSGYSKDINPVSAGSYAIPGTVLPVGTVGGKQEGRLSPAERVYKAKYKAVSLEEAMANMNARRSGKLPPIKGGLDDNTPTRVKQAAPIELQDQQQFDDANIVEAPEGEDCFTPNKEQAPRVATPAQPARVAVSREATYLRQRTRVTLELPDSTMTMQAIDVLHTRYCVTILLPTNTDNATFIPKPGTELTVTENGEEAFKCFYPGATFEVPELSLLGLTFIRSDK